MHIAVNMTKRVWMNSYVYHEEPVLEFKKESDYINAFCSTLNSTSKIIWVDSEGPISAYKFENERRPRRTTLYEWVTETFQQINPDKLNPYCIQLAPFLVNVDKRRHVDLRKYVLHQLPLLTRQGGIWSGDLMYISKHPSYGEYTCDSYLA